MKHIVNQNTDYLVLSQIEFNYLPFFKSLQALRIQLFYCNYISASTFPCCLLIKPAFEDFTKSSLSKNCVRSKILGGSPQFCKREYPQVGGGQDLPIWKSDITASPRKFAIPGDVATLRRRCIGTPRGSCIGSCLRYPRCNHRIELRQPILKSE